MNKQENNNNKLRSVFCFNQCISPEPLSSTVAKKKLFRVLLTGRVIEGRRGNN